MADLNAHTIPEEDMAYSKNEIIIRDALWHFEPHNRDACLKLLNDNKELFRAAPGSRKNHQAYPGGYIKHVADCFDMARKMFVAFSPRWEDIPEDEQFWIRDAQLVMFLHDLEKPWMYARQGTGIAAKEDRAYFRATKIAEYDIKLEEKHITALQQVEGIRDKDYDPNNRGFTPLGAFCHTLDLLSSRVFYQ